MELRQSSTDEAGGTGAAEGWAFPALLAVVLLIAAVVAVRGKREISQQSSDEGWTPSPAAQGETVSLEIDFGNGVQQRFEALLWQPEMTVAELLQAASKFRPGITFTQQGKGKNGFLTALQGLANEEAGGRYWTYQVDGKHGQVSFCLQKLSPGQHVLWKFAAKE